MRTRIYNKMTAAEIEGYLARGGDTIFLPIGVLECHGTMPVDVETIGPEAFGVLLAEKIDGLTMINLPSFYAGGTVISNATVHMTIQDGVEYLDKLCTSLIHQGFKRLYFLSGHGPAKLTIDSFCRDFFERTLIHPCHLNTMYFFQPVSFGDKADMAAIFEKFSKISYGAYKIMNQVEYLPVEPGKGGRLPSKPQEPELVKFTELYAKFGGSPSIIYSSPDEHGGGLVFGSEEERDAYCSEGAEVMRELVDKLDLASLNEALAVYQDYAKRLADKNPRLRNLR